MRLQTEVSIYKKNAIGDSINDAKSSARGVDIYQSASSFLNYTPSSSTQVFLPESITLTPVFTGGLVFGGWYYRLGNASALSSWNSAVGANGITISALNVLTIVPSSTLFSDSCSEIVFQCVDSTGAFAKTVIVSKQIDARSSYSTTSSALTTINNKISLIASTDELAEYSTTDTLASRQNELSLNTDGLLFNAVQSYSVLNNVSVDLYNPLTNYSANSVVISGGKFYSSKSNNNIGNPPPNTTYWNDVSSNYSYENIKTAFNYISSTALGTTAIVCGDGVASEWATSTQYEVGDLVWYTANNQKRLYKCITAHTSTTFSADAAKWKSSVNGSVVDMFADGISLAVQNGSGSSSIDLAGGVLKLQASDFATIMTNNTLNLSSGIINISGSSEVNIGTSASGAITINSPNFSLNSNGYITASGGTIGNFLINNSNDKGLYSELNYGYDGWEDVTSEDISVNGMYMSISAKYNKIEMIAHHYEEMVDEWDTGVRMTPDGLTLFGTEIQVVGIVGSLGGSSVHIKRDGISIKGCDIDVYDVNNNLQYNLSTIAKKTSKSSSYVTSQIVSGLTVYTHAVGVICFSHITGNSPTHAAGSVSSGYTASTGIACAIPTGMTVFDENGKRIKFNINSSGDISITNFIDAVTSSARIDETLIWVASSFPSSLYS